MVHIRRDEPTYYGGILSAGDLDTVLGTHWASFPDISLVRGGEDVPATEYTSESGRIQALDVARQFDGGATVIFRQVQRRVPALARLCVAVGSSFSSRAQANVYLTPANSRGFDPHWDTHDVFVLQVSGTKRWSIHDTKVSLPLRGQRCEPGTPAGELTDEFELRPGSAVYIPRGLMHSAQSAGEASLHITLGLTAFTWAEFLVETVTAAALQEESLRQNLPRAFAREDFPITERQRLLGEKLAFVQSRFDAADVWNRFAAEVLSTDVPLFTDLLAQRLDRHRPTLASRVQRRPGLLTDTVAEGESCHLKFCGRELRFPLAAWPAVRFATTTAEFAVKDLPDCLDADGKLTLVTRLVREGVLRWLPAPAPASEL